MNTLTKSGVIKANGYYLALSAITHTFMFLIVIRKYRRFNRRVRRVLNGEVDPKGMTKL